MTVQVTDRLSQLYVGNGANTRFDFIFRVFDQEDETGVAVRVKVGNDFEFLDESKYSVTVNQDNLGGYVTFKEAPSNQTYFYIAGKTPVDQLLDITNYDNFYPDAIEHALDKLTAILQEWKHLVDFETQARILADLQYDQLSTLRDQELKAYIDGLVGSINGESILGAQFLTQVDSLKDLGTLLQWEGRTVYVKSVVKRPYIFLSPHSGAGEFVFSANSSLQEDGFIVVKGKNGGKWIKKIKDITVGDFGAIANGIDDDSSSFQAYIDSPYTSNVVHLENRAGKYVIKKEVDFKNKGLDGSGFGVQTEQSYNASIYIPEDFEGVNVFKNLMGTLRNLNVKQHTANDLVDFAHIFPYNFTISNVNIDGFGYQIWSTKETCATRISDFTSINARKSAFHFPDTGSDHTTTYLERCHFQWGNYAYICDGNCYGFSFKDIIIEWMYGGLKAKLFTNCTFDTFWCEGRQGNNNNTNKMVIEEVTGQQLLSCHAANFRFIGGWTSPHLENKALTALMGGITIHDSELFASNSTGARIVFSNTGLRTSFSDWYGGVNRRLKIQTQPTSTESGYVTPIEISTPNTGLYFTNIDDNDYRASVFRRVVGKNINSSAQYLAKETLSVNEFSAEAYNEITGDIGKFHAPLMLTWDTKYGVLKAAGWVLSKVAVGQYRLSRDVGNTKEIVNGHLIVSGINANTFIVHRVSAIDTYLGSWNSDRIAAGFDIFFVNLSGNAMDPSRFTVALTLVA